MLEHNADLWTSDGPPEDATWWIPEPDIKQVDTSIPGASWWKKTWNYFTAPNLFVLTQNWKIILDGVKVMLPKGFKLDGASIPWFARWLATSFGPLLRAAISHDYGYRHNYLLDWDGNKILEDAGQKHWDDLFRTIINVTTGLSWLATWAWSGVRTFGFRAFKKHRKNDDHNRTNQVTDGN